MGELKIRQICAKFAPIRTDKLVLNLFYSGDVIVNIFN